MNKILIANFYPVYPFEHGGQRRIYFLARELAREYPVTLVTLSRGKQLKFLEVDQGFTEIQVPAERHYLDLERQLVQGIPMASDVAYALYWKQCRLYQSVLREQLRASQLAISEHPYSFYAIKKANGRHRNVPMIYNSQNVEITQKKPVLDGREDLMQVVRSIERAAVAESVAVIACSEADRTKFASEYSVPVEKIAVIKNGVDSLAVQSVPSEKRDEFRRYLELGDRFTAVFGGSLHFPNLSAADSILATAALLPNMVFIILGSICQHFEFQGPLPPNVLALGSIPESEKWLAFAVSDLALNPMSLGSGSNIKMFEYAAAGLPTLSTVFGARGTGMLPDIHYYDANLDEFASRLLEVARLGRQKLMQVGSTARDFVRETSDWRVIGKQYRALVSAILTDEGERTHREAVDVFAE